MIVWIVFGGIVLLLLLVFVIPYNSFIRLKNQVENAWAQIDVQLKRRADLIPNLIETVKGYVKHERETLAEVTKARTAMMNAGSVQEKAQAENMLSGALKSLFAVAEAYPDLKANTNFLQLQEELTSTENKVAYARQNYNDMVMLYETKRESFPTNFIANMFNFEEKQQFETTGTDREVVSVKF